MLMSDMNLTSEAQVETSRRVRSVRPASASCAQKKRRAPRRVSLLADRQFLNEFRALTGIATGIAPVQASVSPIVVGSSPTPTDPLPFYVTKTPSPWRYTTDEVQAHFALEALRARGPVIGFTAWCSTEISGRAYETGKPLSWLRKRIAEALGDAVGPTEWLVAIEEERKAGAMRLHVHGALGLTGTGRRCLARVRRALRRALGGWTGEAAKRQVRFSIEPDSGWAAYISKRSWLALPGIRDRFACDRPGSQWRLSFDGPTLSMTNGIRDQAKRLHQSAREAVQEARQRAAVAEAPQTARTLAEPACESPEAPEQYPGAGTHRGSIPMFALALDSASDAKVYIDLDADVAGQSQPSAQARSRGPPSADQSSVTDLGSRQPMTRLTSKSNDSNGCRPAEKSRPANRTGSWGNTMHLRVIEVGDLHADLWEGLSIIRRHVDGPEDVTVGDHAQFGLAIVSHRGFENSVSWWTERPIAAPLSSAEALAKAM